MGGASQDHRTHGDAGPSRPGAPALQALRQLSCLLDGAKQACDQHRDRLLHGAKHVAVQRITNLAEFVQRSRPAAPALASLTSGLAARRQPVAEVAESAPDLKDRLSAIPIYTVTNRKNEFVLVSGEGLERRQLGLFFLLESDAHALVAKMKEQNPKLAKQSRVLRVTMDKVYDFAIMPKGTTGPEGVMFRFMPDAQQVHNASAMYTEAGISAEGFTGVPVFQAEGLTVKVEAQRYTPLFLAKADLDAAVSDAFSQRESARGAAAAAKAAQAAQDLSSAKAAAEAASEGEEKEKARAASEDVKRLAARMAAYEGRLGGSKPEARPKVEVGCLEEVISKMSADAAGEWSTVMFIPPGSLS